MSLHFHYTRQHLYRAGGIGDQFNFYLKTMELLEGAYGQSTS